MFFEFLRKGQEILNKGDASESSPPSTLQKETDYTTSHNRDKESISKSKLSLNETCDIEIHKSERDRLYTGNLGFGVGFGLGLVVALILYQLICYFSVL